MARVRLSDELWGYINKAGIKVIDYQFYNASEFHNGLAAARPGNRWGYINKQGEFVIKPVYRNAEDFIVVE